MSSNELSSFYYHFSLVSSVFHCTVVNFTKYVPPAELQLQGAERLYPFENLSSEKGAEREIDITIYFYHQPPRI